MEKIGPIEIEYNENSSSRTLVPAARRALRKLLKAGGGISVRRI